MRNIILENPFVEKELKSIGDKINQRRTERKLSLIDLSAESEVSHISIGRIEKGLSSTTNSMMKLLHSLDLDLKITKIK